MQDQSVEAIRTTSIQSVATLVFAVAVTALAAPSAAAQPQPTGEDDRVLLAVIEHAILPFIRGSNDVNVIFPNVYRSGDVSAKGIALVARQSSAVCDRTQSASPSCRMPEHWLRLLAPDVERGLPSLILDNTVRSAVVASFEARNAEPQPLPELDHPLVVFTDQPRGNVEGITSLSFPGYTGDGLALVYGAYDCDGWCGRSWWFVLSKVGDSWHVQSATIIEIG